MSYRAGTGGLSLVGIPDTSPTITCDMCGKAHEVKWPPPAWFLDGKAPPGWRIKRDSDTRTDWCKACKAKVSA